MVSTLVVNTNTYITRTEASDILDDDIRTSLNWKSVGSNDKDRALLTAFAQAIELEAYEGDEAGHQTIATVAIAVGGTGYAVDDVLTVSGGTAGDVATVKVTSVSGGVVDGIQLLNSGIYSDVPTSPVSTTVAPAGGTGCTLTVTFQTQVTQFPRTGLTDQDNDAVASTTVPQRVKDAQAYLAYEISQDSEFLTNRDTSSNIESVGAGSARVSFFRPTRGRRFPQAIQNLLSVFLSSSSSGPQVFVSGTANESNFDVDDSDGYDLVGGYY